MDRIDQHIEREQDSSDDQLSITHDGHYYHYCLTDSAGNLISRGSHYPSMEILGRHLDTMAFIRTRGHQSAPDGIGA
jgi:hypothetical protein